MRLEGALDKIASQRATHTALRLANGDALTFAQLVATSTKFAHRLLDDGVAPGDRVAIVSRHDLDAIALFWAILRVGGIVVWLNDDARNADLSYVLDSARPVRIFVQTEKHLALFGQDNIYAARAQRINALTNGARPDSATSLPVLTDDNAPAVIVYTSGSSGTPKGVCLSHRNITTVDHAVIQHMPITEDDSYMMVVPLHYVHGLMQLTVHALAGATVHFFEHFMFPKKVVDAIRETKVRGFSGVPFHFNALISRGGLLDAELPDLRWMTVTGGKLAANTIISIIDHFTELDFHIAYGQTECAPRATALHPSKIRTKPDSVGQAIPGVTVTLVDDDGNAIANGDVGEVTVAGDNIMLGYWNDTKSTSTTIDSLGRLRTGDLGRFDGDGDLFLVGRRSAMIKSAGERIVPEELERALMACADVEDAVVVGVDDPLLGQRVVAHLQFAAGKPDDQNIAIATVRKTMSQTVALAKLPRDYHVWSDFPRKANGKPDRVRMTQGKEDHG